MRLSTVVLFALVVAYLIDPEATLSTLRSIWHGLQWGVGREIAHTLFSQRHW